IVAVSDFTLMTKERHATIGTKLAVPSNATNADISEWQGTSGTTIVVENLFGKVPARRAFLKSARVEFGYILEIVQAFALARPDIGFTLKHQDKVALQCEKTTTQKFTRLS